jgi:hypothetical protein
MPLAIPFLPYIGAFFTGAFGWFAGMWTSDGFSNLFWLGVLALVGFLAFHFLG